MRIDLAGLVARLERGIGEEVLRRAAERAVGVLAEGVRARLSEVLGGAHEAPWVESGALRDSIGVAVEGDAGGARAVVGSSDPAKSPWRFARGGGAAGDGDGAHAGSTVLGAGGGGDGGGGGAGGGGDGEGGVKG